MINRLALGVVLLVGAVGAVHATPIAAPGPDIESGLVGLTLASGFAWVLNRRRNRQ
jgi:hypothetical protein